MSEFWNLIANPRTDPNLVRVYRWLMQWPEAWAFFTQIDPTEASRATGLSVEVVTATLRTLIAEKYMQLYHERSDGVMWVVVSWSREREEEKEKNSQPQVRVAKIPPERCRAPDLKLRWKILERDGKRCRVCGATAEDGAKLVIDHIKPFSKGGLTVEDNLQTLCRDCNAGKHNRWLEIA